MTSTGDVAGFVSTSDFISTFNNGILKLLLSDTKTLKIYRFCVKVIDDSGYGYSDIVDDLSLQVIPFPEGVFSHVPFKLDQIVH